MTNYVRTRGGVFGPGGRGGGIFDGSNMGFGAVGQYEQAAAGIGGCCGTALGLLDPTGQSWNTVVYQACIGRLFQDCGEKYEGAQLEQCLEAAQQECIRQAKAAMTQTLSSAEIKALQTKINSLLSKYEYCPIAVDGILGGQTCGAAAWAAGIDSTISVPGACSNIAMTFRLSDCPSGTPPPEPKPAPLPAPPPDDTVYLPPSEPGVSAAWIVGGLAVALLAGTAYAMSRKKKAA
jgi:hypothetical protein